MPSYFHQNAENQAKINAFLPFKSQFVKYYFSTNKRNCWIWSQGKAAGISRAEIHTHTKRKTRREWKSGKCFRLFHLLISFWWSFKWKSVNSKGKWSVCLKFIKIHFGLVWYGFKLERTHIEYPQDVEGEEARNTQIKRANISL